MLNDIVEDYPIAQFFRLEQNYPNPFNLTMQIQYTIPLTSFVTFNMYDVIDRELVTLVSQTQDQGLSIVKLDAGSFAAGIYVYHLSPVPVAHRDIFTKTKKLCYCDNDNHERNLRSPFNPIR